MMIGKQIKPDAGVRWLRPDNGRKIPQVTLTPEGRLYVGKVLREKLTGLIRVGFLEQNCTLVIEENREDGFHIGKAGWFSMTQLSALLLQSDIALPAKFVFEKNGNSGRWVGVMDPYHPPIQRCKRRKNPPISAEKVLKTHGFLIERVTAACAKTTPAEDRRSVATEEFCVAINEYTPAAGPLQEYLMRRMERRLIAENKSYTAISNHVRRSMDVPLKVGGENFSLYDCIEGSGADEVAAAELSMDCNMFLKTLTEEEQTICKQLQEGYTQDEISEGLGISPLKLKQRCDQIGQRRAAFFG